ncbi:hypothetical protein KFE25_007058 [Diacronema lutheri]|uniref:PDZ domain-containing protein n=2 Tax=Diacronema lutheri TaxID=2081491 RepID=A0A8J6CEC8_DIALT|nr:hypothetical protein KFE25_007058 [Diacronema lutheri]
MSAATPPPQQLALNLAPTRKPLVATSNDLEGSNTAGIVTVRDSMGTPRSVRVVQKEEPEGVNMIKISWFYILEDKTYTIELRHGRLSGIRKIYVNKELILRDKRIVYALSARASMHDFDVGPKRARIVVEPASGAYSYQLFIDGRIVESAPPAATEIKSKIVRVVKDRRIGMTLQNNANGPGVVVVHFQPESAARDAGVAIGDILLSVNGEPTNTHEVAVHKIDLVKEGEAFLLAVAFESALHGARGARETDDNAVGDDLST